MTSLTLSTSYLFNAVLTVASSIGGGVLVRLSDRDAGRKIVIKDEIRFAIFSPRLMGGYLSYIVDVYRFLDVNDFKWIFNRFESCNSFETLLLGC